MNEYEMMDELRVWFRANAARFREPPVSGQLRRSELEDETLTPPLYKAGFDFKNADALASFTVWGSGEFQVIIMDARTAKEVVVDDRRLEDSTELHQILDYYRDQILSGGPFKKY